MVIYIFFLIIVYCKKNKSMIKFYKFVKIIKKINKIQEINSIYL